MAVAKVVDPYAFNADLIYLPVEGHLHRFGHYLEDTSVFTVPLPEGKYIEPQLIKVQVETIPEKKWRL